MKYRIALLATVLFSSSLLADSSVKRIISLAPHATEIAFAAGLGDKLIAATDHSDYPDAAKKLERVANYQGIKLERIVALQPDLIITWPSGNPAKELDKLKKLGFKIYESKTGTFQDITNNLIQLSQYADDPTIGKKAAKDFELALANLKQRYATDQPVKYFYQLSTKPIITVAQHSWPSEVFSYCGGENIFVDSASPYPQVGEEQVVIRQPDVIFTSRHAVQNESLWNGWASQVPAVQHKQVWSLNSDWINRPTPRTVYAVEQVCDFFEQARKNIK
ncbi:vitamin B12 ABC transporter substrate-binding protein BtuF [Vibrio sp. SCSIO 43132]|uniref:vitamin B12 ABC transporter substrate-binding protein BtuF n=1 Tax=Vibrio sp. SCSIO 43132 TaxID=2779363 RepID=UPI00223C08A1|nr:vitamin B12 ABC transporter substrate-binding protein BtuF [Vibrio sp. SCSIO 43132]